MSVNEKFNDFGQPVYETPGPDLIDAPDADTTYLGFLLKDGTYFIKKITVSGTVTSFEKASGVDWADRATASYVSWNAKLP